MIYFQKCQPGGPDQPSVDAIYIWELREGVLENNLELEDFAALHCHYAVVLWRYKDGRRRMQ